MSTATYLSEQPRSRKERVLGGLRRNSSRIYGTVALASAGIVSSWGAYQGVKGFYGAPDPEIPMETGGTLPYRGPEIMAGVQNTADAIREQMGSLTVVSGGIMALITFGAATTGLWLRARRTPRQPVPRLVGKPIHTPPRPASPGLEKHFAGVRKEETTVITPQNTSEELIVEEHRTIVLHPRRPLPPTPPPGVYPPQAGQRSTPAPLPVIPPTA